MKFSRNSIYTDLACLQHSNKKYIVLYHVYQEYAWHIQLNSLRFVYLTQPSIEISIQLEFFHFHLGNASRISLLSVGTLVFYVSQLANRSEIFRRIYDKYSPHGSNITYNWKTGSGVSKLPDGKRLKHCLEVATKLQINFQATLLLGSCYKVTNKVPTTLS